jgi:hypothetical protein
LGKIFNANEFVEPGLDRLRGRGRYGEAKARASTSFLPGAKKTWMAGTSPAITIFP